MQNNMLNDIIFNFQKSTKTFILIYYCQIETKQN